MSADGGTIPEAAGPRRFEHGERTWLAMPAGSAVSGKPWLSPAPVQLIRFAHADSPDSPLREVVAPPRPIADLFDEELIELFERARPLPEPAPPAPQREARPVAAEQA